MFQKFESNENRIMNLLERNESKFKRAKVRIEVIKNFYMHLLVYCIVLPCLAILNYNTTDFPWVLIPMLGLGFGLLVHGMSAFGYSPLWNKNWEARKIEEFMNDTKF